MLDNCKVVIEALFGFSLVINATLFIPQIVKLFKTKDADGLSFFTFLGFNCMQFLGALHCYLKEDYLPMLGWIASLFTCGVITILIIFYRSKEDNHGKTKSNL